MSDDAVSFMALLASGRARQDQIDDFIELWHEGSSTKDLASFLGMSEAEYSLWLIAPHLLPLIAEARAEREALPDVIERRRSIFLPMSDPGEIERVDHWLAAHVATSHAP